MRAPARALTSAAAGLVLVALGLTASTGSPARVPLVAALALVACAVHRSARGPLVGAGGAALVAAVLAGPALLPATVCAAVGGALLLRAGRGPSRATSRLGFRHDPARAAPGDAPGQV